MPTAKVKLRSLLRESISGLSSKDRPSTPEIVDRFLDSEPQGLEEEKNRLLRQALGDWVRQIFAEFEPKEPRLFPDFFAGIDTRISIRIDGIRRWVYPEDLSVNQLKALAKEARARRRADVKADSYAELAKRAAALMKGIGNDKPIRLGLQRRVKKIA